MKKQSETKVLNSVSSTVNFIKERLIVDLKEAAQRKMFSIDEKELEKICRISTLSIESNFSRGITEVIKTLEDDK